MQQSSNQISLAITWLRFPLIFLVIMLHAYSVVQIPGEHATYFKVVYPFALWLGETGVPGFFLISGFLFFRSHKTYFEKIKARCHSLLHTYYGTLCCWLPILEPQCLDFHRISMKRVWKIMYGQTICDYSGTEDHTIVETLYLYFALCGTFAI